MEEAVTAPVADSVVAPYPTAVPLDIFLNVVEQFGQDPLYLRMTHAKYKLNLSNLSRVCRLSRNIALRHLYSFLTFSGRPEDVGHEETYLAWLKLSFDGNKFYRRMAGHVRRLYIEDWPQNPAFDEENIWEMQSPLLIQLCEALVSAAEFFPNVDTIILRNIPMFDSSLQVLAAFPRLRNVLLDDWEAGVANMRVPPSPLSRLTNLVIRNVARSSFPEAAVALVDIDNIRKLGIPWTAAKTLFKRLGESNMPVLEELYLDIDCYSQLPQPDADLLWRSLGQMPAVQVLKFERDEFIAHGCRQGLTGHLTGQQLSTGLHTLQVTGSLARCMIADLPIRDIGVSGNSSSYSFGPKLEEELEAIGHLRESAAGIVHSLTIDMRLLDHIRVAQAFQHVETLTVTVRVAHEILEPAFRDLEFTESFPSLVDLHYDFRCDQSSAGPYPSYWCDKRIRVDLKSQLALIRENLVGYLPSLASVTFGGRVQWNRDLTEDGPRGTHWHPVITDCEGLRRDLSFAQYSASFSRFVTDVDGCLSGILTAVAKDVSLRQQIRLD